MTMTRNETADRPAKQAECLKFIGQSWTENRNNQCTSQTLAVAVYRNNIIVFALRLNIRQPRTLVGLLTGHIRILNRHVSVIKIQTDPLLTPYEEQQETSYHLLGKCCVNTTNRNRSQGQCFFALGEPDLCKRVFWSSLFMGCPYPPSL